MVMLAEGEYNPSQGTCSKNDEKDQNHHVPPAQEMAPAVFSPIAEKRAKITAVVTSPCFVLNLISCVTIGVLLLWFVLLQKFDKTSAIYRTYFCVTETKVAG